MEANEGGKRYDLAERTFAFAQAVRAFVKTLPRSVSNIEDVRQLIRASGSVGANYIEASEAVSKKDFHHRMKISRKEAKESHYFLRLLDVGGDAIVIQAREHLAVEAFELTKIFGKIVRDAE